MMVSLIKCNEDDNDLDLETLPGSNFLKHDPRPLSRTKTCFENDSFAHQM